MSVRTALRDAGMDVVSVQLVVPPIEQRLWEVAVTVWVVADSGREAVAAVTDAIGADR